MNRKDSLDRFGDDLARLILSYHSIGYIWFSIDIAKRCGHECVSKQFQRVIFDTITDIYINKDMIVKFKAKESANRLSDEELCQKLIAFLQKKCPNIENVCFGHNIYDRPLFEAIDHSRNRWPNLNRIGNCSPGVISDNQLDTQFVEYLLSSFGPMITTYSCDKQNLLPYLTGCPNLSLLWTPSLRYMFTTEEDNQLLAFNRLIKYTFCWKDNDFNGHRFQVFIDYYKTQLRCLGVCLIDPSIEWQPMVTQLMTQLTQFQELKELSLKFTPTKTMEYSLYSYLKSIGIKCAKLKKLSLNISSNDTALNVEIINAIQFMPRLKRLELALRLFSGAEELITDWTQLQPLNRWPQLTHLSLGLWDFPLELMEQIVSTQKRVKTLIITKIDGQYLPSISRLSSLESLSIFQREFRCKKCDLIGLFNGCPKLRWLSIGGSTIGGKDFNGNNSIFVE